MNVQHVIPMYSDRILLRKLLYNNKRFIDLESLFFSYRYQQHDARPREVRRDMKNVNNRPGVRKVPDNKQKPHDNKRDNKQPVRLFDFL